MGWVKKIILAFVILLIIGALFGNDEMNNDSTNTMNGQENVNLNINSETTNQKEYVPISLDEMIIDFVSTNSELTDLQKEEKFKAYDGKYIKDSAIVKEIDTVALSDSIVVRTINPENEFMNGATIYFKSTEKEKLLTLNKYDKITFEGKIEDYNSLLGIIIKDAEVR